MAIIAILIIVGLLLLFLETILPGLIAGSIGLLLLAAAVVYAYSEIGLRAGNTTLVTVVLLLAVAAILWIKFFPDSAVARMFVSQSVVGDIGTDKPELLDQTGVTFTDLRPAGTALINGKRVDVVTEGGFIPTDTKVRVVQVEGYKVVVRPLEDEAPAQPA